MEEPLAGLLHLISPPGRGGEVPNGCRGLRQIISVGARQGRMAKGVASLPSVHQ